MPGTFSGSASALQHLTPRAVKGLFADNYLSIDGGDFDFTKQFLPEVYEKEIERFGNRTVAGFLTKVGAEEALESDEIVWSEQGRLHIGYDDVAVKAATTDVLEFPAGHVIGTNMTLVIATANGLTVDKALVTAVSGQEVTVKCYGSQAALNAAIVTEGQAGSTLKVFVYGSEYGKRSTDGGNSFDAPFTTFTNKPIIMREQYEIGGSDMTQIGWVEATTENGGTGYLWYLKSSAEQRLRFLDYCEMAMIEGKVADVAITDAQGKTVTGTEGFFEAIEDRGLVFANSDFDTNGVSDFDLILQELDKQGAIEENLMFLNRGKEIEVDNMLAAQNSYGTGGTSYGAFQNSADMALNLGFSDFRGGSYDFYKTSWKYLNDGSTRGMIGDIEGALVPAGVSSVYDKSLGRNIKRPFLHVRYRANQVENRKMKSWIIGSAGGANNSAADEMAIKYLTERCLVTQAANNFVLFKKTA